MYFYYIYGRSQWLRCLRRRSAAARLLRLWVLIPPRACMSVCCECCLFSGRALCDKLITRPEVSYRLRCVAVCDLETSWMRRPWPTGGCCAKNKQTLPVLRAGNLHVCCLSYSGKSHSPEYHSLQWLSITNITQSIRKHYADTRQAILTL